MKKYYYIERLDDENGYWCGDADSYESSNLELDWVPNPEEATLIEDLSLAYRISDFIDYNFCENAILNTML